MGPARRDKLEESILPQRVIQDGFVAHRQVTMSLNDLQYIKGCVRVFKHINISQGHAAYSKSEMSNKIQLRQQKKNGYYRANKGISE